MRPPVRHGLSLAVVTVAVAALADPVAAQSVNADLIDRLNEQLLYVALPLTVFVELILVYVVLRFRNNDDPSPTASDPALEITWTAATAVILLFVGVSAYTVLASPYISPNVSADPGEDPAEARVITGAAPDDAVVVGGLAYQWGWEFTYSGANVTTQDELVVPADRDVYLRLRSADVLHSLFVPELGLKQDVFPGSVTTVRTYVYREGQYRAYCAELCGAGHARMRATVTVVSPERYRTWLREHEGRSNVTDVPRPANATATPG